MLCTVKKWLSESDSWAVFVQKISAARASQQIQNKHQKKVVKIKKRSEKIKIFE